MTFKLGHFEFFIGSVTLDAYRPIQGGTIYLLDSTHGYDRQTLHLATRYPRPLPPNGLVGTVFPFNVWMAIGISLFMIIAMIYSSIVVYMNAKPSIVRLNLDLNQIFIRLVAGFTEPDDGSWFKTYSTGE